MFHSVHCTLLNGVSRTEIFWFRLADEFFFRTAWIECFGASRDNMLEYLCIARAALFLFRNGFEVEAYYLNENPKLKSHPRKD